MRIGVLGPLEVLADGTPVPVGGVRLRALLIRLALDPGRVVSAPALIEALWPDGGPRRPSHALHSLTSRLRQVLPDGSVLRSAPTGYRLDLPSTAVDAFRFEQLARAGRRALEDGDASRATAHLREALELWRGDPLADVAQARYAGAVIARPQELRLVAIEDRLAAELATDAVRPAIAELEQLTTAHPLRERLRWLLVRALHTDGRQAEALAAYAAYRQILADELGNDPGPELAEHLHQISGGPGYPVETDGALRNAEHQHQHGGSTPRLRPVVVGTQFRQHLRHVCDERLAQVLAPRRRHVRPDDVPGRIRRRDGFLADRPRLRLVDHHLEHRPEYLRRAGLDLGTTAQFVHRPEPLGHPQTLLRIQVALGSGEFDKNHVPNTSLPAACRSGLPDRPQPAVTAAPGPGRVGT
ncbi:AfsR/SARP family transcriptional regulator [Plantactinospora sp. S1510]|uniref:AfsR/SARP family transcriptional regulator n=1 Tax=Plantactinospora alkalitolerans TaxID=2789879 RepID=A0ABS0GUH5_9ACTN|nr:AfsR/SARP family transcriptional regulator [Plantactinospora alkalitolerans]MBF9129859.1 AfsR/SARP family transcriptional regulator [Plantactinospora alkalitolerans]